MNILFWIYVIGCGVEPQYTAFHQTLKKKSSQSSVIRKVSTTMQVGVYFSTRTICPCVYVDSKLTLNSLENKSLTEHLVLT